EMHEMAVRVAEHLHLDVAGPLHVTLEDHAVVAEGRARLPARGGQRGREVLRPAHRAHALAAAAPGRLEDHGPPDRPRGREQGAVRLVVAVVPGDHRHAGGRHQAPGRLLVAHGPVDGGRRADEREAGASHRLRKVGALAQEAVAGMDGVGPGPPRRRHQGLGVEVGARGVRGADEHRRVRFPEMERIPIRLGVDRDRRNAHDPARAGHAHGDLTPVGNEDLAEQAFSPTMLPSARMRALHDAAASFLIFFVVGLALAWPGLRWPMVYDDLHLVRAFTAQEKAAAWRGSWDPDGIEHPGLRPLTVLFNDARYRLFGEQVAAHRVFLV